MNRMRPVVSCAAALGFAGWLAASAGGADTLAERFAAYDKNSDGKVTAEELAMPALFARLDLNADGSVTLEEARRALVRVAAPKDAAPEKSADGKSNESATTPAAAIAPVRQGPRLLKPSEHGVGRYVADATFSDLAGGEHQLSDWKNERAVVVCLTSTSCPLSKKYLPTIAETAKTFGPRGVQFVVVDAVATDEASDIQAAANTLGPNTVYVHDAAGKLAQAVGATTTTDAIVLDPSRTVVYHGAIDDQYGFGYAVDAPRRRYLAEALEAVLQGRAAAIAATEAPGCALESPAVAASSAPAVTYHNRISRIVAQNCAECHRPGGVGPFSLLSAEDVTAHAPMIRQVVDRDVMPPWFAAHGDANTPTPWSNDRSLSEADKADLLAWLDGGKPLGDARDGIPPPRYADDWQIGKPDAVFEFPRAVPIKATGTMPYQNVVVETNLPDDKWVQAIEIRPGDRGVVHHVLVFAEQPADAAENSDDQSEGRNGFWAIYVPGNSTQVFPSGFAKRLPAGARLRFQMHYTPNGTATEDRTSIGLKFAARPPEHEVRVAGVVNTRLSIPPGAANHEEIATLRLPFDVRVLGFLPHMHLRGKACRYEVVGDDGTQLLLDIPRYDFNWQLLYSYFDPLPLAAGSTLRFTAWFDNSDGNPANPDPTRTVRWGPQTYDEMHLGYVEYYVPGAKPGEGPSINRGARIAGGAAQIGDALFTRLDVDGDGSLSKDELKKGAEQSARLRDKPALFEALFRRLDADDNAKIDKTEFGTLRDALGGTH